MTTMRKSRVARLRRVAALTQAASVLTLALASCGGASEPERPDVVLVLIDTLRPDHLPAWGYERDTAPFLTRIAAESAVFERAYSTSTWTAPATASLFTSLYPTQHGVTHGFFVHRQKLAEQGKLDPAKLSLRRISDDCATLPELFQRAGYDTLGLAANINIGEQLGFTRGFTRFEHAYGGEDPKGAKAAKLIDTLASWRDELDDDEPDFVYLHLNDVHEPHDRTLPHYEKQADELADARAAYDAEIRAVDAALERAYRELGWDQGTLFVVVSDHGEEFGEHGGTGHGFSVYRELAQIALMVRAPELGIAPRRVRENVSILDVAPTLAELCGIAGPRFVAGASLADTLTTGAPPRVRELFVHRTGRTLKPQVEGSPRESLGELWGVIDGDWQLVRREDGLELYDLARDPRQIRNLAEVEPQVVARLSAVLAEFEAHSTAASGSDVDIELDPAQAEALRKLGYVGDQ